MSVNKLLGAAAIDPRVEFWSHPNRWPIEAPEYIFLGRAVLDLGRERFGDQWSDEIPAAEWVLELPETLDLYTPAREVWRGASVLRSCSASYRSRINVPEVATLLPRPLIPTHDEWKEAVAQVKEDAKASWNRLKPAYALEFELIDNFIRGVVKTALRPSIGGEPVIQDWHFWNFEGSWTRFDTCRVSLGEPFSRTPSTDGSWIFVERSTFQAWMKQPRQLASSGAIDRPTMEQVKSRRPAGRKRGSQTDQIVGRYVHLRLSEVISDRTPDREVARQLQEWAALIWDEPLDLDYLRKCVAVWKADNAGGQGEMD